MKEEYKKFHLERQINILEINLDCFTNLNQREYWIFAKKNIDIINSRIESLEKKLEEIINQ